MKAIKWKLAEVMESRQVNNRQLELATGMTQAWISRLKMAEVMPERLSYATLSKLCAALDCEPGDLMRIK